ncbi:hypothetical protein CSKR_102081 [Clonorchis sinensis]|uniref:Uncharacterized protein n=1 Tax=Clonorchis sinensis TaxID=79923 RepID=A0A3R7FPJ2_CLOSI|nr:hypothetical protein CSKR_102081 [Clonorchis sinensis]
MAQLRPQWCSCIQAVAFTDIDGNVDVVFYHACLKNLTPNKNTGHPLHLYPSLSDIQDGKLEIAQCLRCALTDRIGQPDFIWVLVLPLFGMASWRRMAVAAERLFYISCGKIPI